MMLEYPVKLEPDDNDTILVTSPDFPELTTFGETEDDALARAMDAFDEAIAARISGREDVPAPSRGRVRMRLRSLTAAKVLLTGPCVTRASAGPSWRGAATGICNRWTGC